MFPQPRYTLLLIRHGQTQANVEGRFYGRSDSPMTPTGHAQVQATAERLKDRPVCHLYSSPAIRAKGTAEILNKQWKIPLTLDERLWEIDHNRWELMTAAEIQTTYPTDWANFIAGGNMDTAHHGGETQAEVAERGCLFLDELKTRHAGNGETIALAAHGGFLQILLCELLGTANRSYWPYRFQNAGVAEVIMYDFGGVLTSFQ
ncbi:MAG: broad specificity phosphatase PhoE [Cellvibrionaceae bacterium]|jgi:broad specificity phosphatase PhoE